MTTIDPERQTKAKEYARITRRLWLVDTTFTAVYALAWLFFGWSISSAQLAHGCAGHIKSVAIVPLFVLVFGGIYFVLNLPLGYYEGFVLPHRFGPIDSILKDWIVDQLKGMAVGAPLGLIVLEMLYSFLRATRQLMVAVGRGRIVGLQCFALQPCADSHHADLQ